MLRNSVNLFYRPYVLRRIKQAEVLSIDGYRIETGPSVFHPSLFQSTTLLVSQVKKLNLEGKRVLDMGSGTGVIALVAAVHGAHVTAADNNPAAVALCKKNFSMNSVKIEILESDLFSGLSNRQFDVVLFNIPFYPKPAGGRFDSAFNAGKDFELIHRFARDVPLHLCDNGMVMIIFSEDSGFERVTQFFEEAGLEVRNVVPKTAIFEHYYIVAFRKKNSPDGHSQK